MIFKNLFKYKPFIKDEDPDSVKFDAHCHIFNIEFLLLEIMQIYHDILEGKYPLYHGEKEKSGLLPAEKDDDKANLFEIIDWLVETLGAVFGSEMRNAEFLRDTARKCWNTKRLRLIPLTMDIYFMHAIPMDRDTNYRALQHGKREYSKKSFKEVENHLLQLLAKKGIKINFKKFPFRNSHKSLLRWVKRRIKKHNRTRIPGFEGVHMTAGFTHQIKEILKVSKKIKGEVFPFLAVDPRREGIVDAVLKGDLVSKSGPFYGVKLYPRLGAHPENPAFTELYKWCEENSIPITTHASYKGFPDNLMDFAEFGNPKNFKAVLDRYSKIKINFAHFGDRSDNRGWDSDISDFITKYPGAFTDLSCFTHEKTIKGYIKKYPFESEIWDKIMYGSDFDVMFFTNPGEINLDEYLDMFKKNLGSENLQKTSSINPKKFLCLKS